jgi:hypothetical protein
LPQFEGAWGLTVHQFHIAESCCAMLFGQKSGSFASIGPSRSESVAAPEA